MKVIDLLNEIYNSNYDELPEKIKIDDEIWKRGEDCSDYFNKLSSLIAYLDSYYAVTDWITMDVEEVKENIKLKFNNDEEYWYVNDLGRVNFTNWEDDNIDNYRYDTNNCFKTKEEAEQHLENIKTEIELRQLAEELNKGEKIDWNDIFQSKYFLYYNFTEKGVYKDWDYTAKFSKQIYCLDKNFKDKAMEQIGEEKLINYLKEE